MSLREEIINERIVNLGLDKVDTKQVFNELINYYRKEIQKKPRTFVGFAIDIALSNYNNCNRLGLIEKLYKKWGDTFYIDFNNSAFVELEINRDGNVETGESIEFIEIDNLKNIENTAFSLKELIEICRESNMHIELYAKSEEDITSVEILPNDVFEEKYKIKLYLESTK